ncbi:protein of unknown function [Rhodovastum atsumiense]|nr:protein of unknown function [Rhodovastum atsumiense]
MHRGREPAGPQTPPRSLDRAAPTATRSPGGRRRPRPGEIETGRLEHGHCCLGDFARDRAGAQPYRDSACPSRLFYSGLQSDVQPILFGTGSPRKAQARGVGCPARLMPLRWPGPVYPTRSPVRSDDRIV